MRLLSSLMCLLLLGTSICGCAHLGTHEENGQELAGDYEENVDQEEAADGSEDGGDGYNDGDAQKDEDVMTTSLNLASNSLATDLAINPAVKLRSGDTVTIQVVHSMRLHIGCPTGRCGAGSCAGMYYEPEEYVKCRGEVFQIYRAAGPGDVKVGDKVGLYFPARKRWVRAIPNPADLAPCPGIPRNSHHRLNLRCWGEVLQLYARGKRIGQPIDQLDHVMIYYTRGRIFMSYSPTNAHNSAFRHSSCPGKCLPPYPDLYERCYTTVFAIRKKLH